MGLVAFNKWEEKFKCKMKEHINDNLIPDAFKAVKEASKATCLIRRVKGSEERKNYHEEMARKYPDSKSYHETKMKNWKKGGIGTGLLLQPKFLGQGWLVITNNHVIMNECEAETAEVYFDYNQDVQKGEKIEEVCKMYKVKGLVSSSLRTENSGDATTLDYSLLLLKPDEQDDEEFLAGHAISFDESLRVQATSKGGERPLVMFSHPHGLAKRLSIGPFPPCISYPVEHIKHALGSLQGSSGGNLLFSSVYDKDFKKWHSAFVHYRHGHAVSWQAIGDHLRAVLAKKDLMRPCVSLF